MGALSTLPLMHNRKPISKDAIGDLGHFPVQQLAKFYSFHSSPRLQQKEIGPTLQMGIMLQLSMASTMLACIRTAPTNIKHILINAEHCLPVQQSGKDHMPLPVFQLLKGSRHLLKEIRLVSVKLKMLLISLRKYIYTQTHVNTF